MVFTSKKQKTSQIKLECFCLGRAAGNRTRIMRTRIARNTTIPQPDSFYILAQEQGISQTKNSSKRSFCYIMI